MRYQAVGMQPSSMDQYYQYYHSQSGRGGFPVFVGARVQHGAGFGDILRGLFKWASPIISGAARGFVTNTASELEKGKSLGDAAKASLLPALGSGVSEFRKKQSGGGRKRRRSVYKGPCTMRPRISKSKKTNKKRRSRRRKSKQRHFNF